MSDTIILPPKYYLSYFKELMEFVRLKSGHLLNEAEQRFIEEFELLPEPAQCLYLRMLNRRGHYFRLSKFFYAEIPDIGEALLPLLEKGFAEKLGGSHLPHFEQVLRLYTKPELLALEEVRKTQLPGLSKLKKEELVRHILDQVDLSGLLPKFVAEDLLTAQGFVEEVEMLLFLFFGTIEGDMSQFVIRDVGHVRFEAADPDKMSAFFQNRQEAEQKLAFSKAYQYFKDLRDLLPPEELYALLAEWLAQTENPGPAAAPLRNRMILKMGRFLERQGLPQQAMAIYAYTDEPPSRERRVRLLKQMGELDAACALCLQIGDAPANAEEKYFAEDFLQKQASAKHLKKTTQFLKAAETISLPEQYRYQVEAGVLAHFQAQGYEGVHSENYLWRGLLGLLLWDVIFDEQAAAIHHPFQSAPSDFYQPGFYQRRKGNIAKRLALLSDKKAAQQQLGQLFTEKYGIHNPLVGWHEALLPALLAMTDHVPGKVLQTVLTEMTQNLKENTRGFPDLFVWRSGDYLFAEVKSPTDSLSAQQLYWLEFFAQNGVNAAVVHVEWEPSPE